MTILNLGVSRLLKQLFPKFPLKGLNGAGLLTAAIAIAVIALLIFEVSGSLREEIDEQASTKTDATQWSLAQTEVDVRRLHVAVLSALNGNGGLQNVRRDYDILFSRVNTTSQGQQFHDVRQDQTAQDALAAMASFLTKYEPLIDGADDALIESLQEMDADLQTLAQEARTFALAGVRSFAASSDVHRNSVGQLLSRIAFLTLILVTIFVVVVFFLLKLIRQSAMTEADAAESHNRLQEVISTSIDGILTIGRDGRIIDYNGAAERMFGYSHDEAIGAMMSELIIPPHLRDAHEQGMARYRETGEHRVVGKGLLRLEAMRKDGLVFPVELTISEARADGHEIFVSYIRDISDRVEAEQELIEARDKAVAGEQAKADLIAVMSHEMRTPLNGLLGTMELLQGTELDAGQSRYLSAMETSANLLLHHVNGVLSMSKADAGRLELHNETLAPGAFLEELVESQSPAFEANGNHISVDTKHAPERIWVDKVKLLQVVLNLVANANKFTRNGDISVECDQLADGGTVEFRITDTGIGIAHEDQQAIFEDFRTLDTSYGRMAEGSGLGLGISRRLVEAMGGSMHLESEPGVGSIFSFRLPVGSPDTQGIDDHERTLVTERVGGHLRVLLVEDNEINRLVASDMLMNAGHLVEIAEDGAQGVSLAEAQPFDLILMDISMPELDGVEATGLIRKGNGPNRDAPIVALTAHALPEDRRRFSDAGITETIVKPLSVTSLNATISALQRTTEVGSLDSPTHTNDVIAILKRQMGERATLEMVQTFTNEVDGFLQTHTPDPMGVSPDVVHRFAGSASVLGCSETHVLLQIFEDHARRGRRLPQAFFVEFATVWEGEKQILLDAVQV